MEVKLASKPAVVAEAMREHAAPEITDPGTTARGKSRRSVLLITIGFPPERSGGFLRPAKLAKYLPRSGWSAVVVTSRVGKGAAGEPVPPNTVVYRAPRMDVTALVGRLRRDRRDLVSSCVPAPETKTGRLPAAPATRRWSDWVTFPDDRAFWIPGAVVAGWFASRRHQVGVLYSTSPATSTLIVGFALKWLTGLPWVVEFRDLWIQNPFRLERPLRVLERLDRWLEAAVIRGADRVIVISAPMREQILAAHHEIRGEDVVVLPNGFDPDDFEGLERRELAGFVIVHAGTFYERRSAAPFLDGLHRWLETQPRLRQTVRVYFVGAPDENSRRLIADLGLEDVVTLVGNVLHRESLRYMVSADLLLLVPGPGEGTMTGKVFEYLAARRPILAVAGRGVVRDLVTSSGIGVCAPPEEPAAIATALASLYDQISTGAYRYPDTEALRKEFDRAQIARQTAALLDSLTAACPTQTNEVSA